MRRLLRDLARIIRREQLRRLQPENLSEDEALERALRESLEEDVDDRSSTAGCFPGALQVYDAFFDQCHTVGQELLVANKIKHEDIEAMDSGVVLSLNAVVILRSLLLSAGTSGLKLSDGFVVQDSVMNSGDVIAQRMLLPFQETRDLLEKIKPSDADTQWMENRLLRGGEVEANDETRPLADVCVKINDLAIKVTQLGVFKQRAWQLYETLSAVPRMISRTLSKEFSQEPQGPQRPLLQSAS